jgi:hypothetical protein
MPKTSFDLKLPAEAPVVLVPGGDLAKSSSTPIV